ncbi:MAG: glycerol-3-phosphate 1-O-acyltransferase PlsY [Rhodospirillaceae bacterium]|nr:glycerol-3-phosphate 1-O-acyltransferase PlsY [Rhodospirillaceae bacterium]
MDSQFIADALRFLLGIRVLGWQEAWPYLAIAVCGGYLLGSIPFGLVLTRLAGLGDVRKIGSGNIGMTNVLRTGRKDLAAFTLLLDAGKGALAVFCGYWWINQDYAVLAGLGAFLGHLFPIWLLFRGGKGVATGAGILFALSWPVGVLAGLTWLLVAVVTRYASLSALVACALAPVYAYAISQVEVAGTYFADAQRTQFFIVLAVLVWFAHRGNIVRLVSGTERKLGEKKG